ncbi:MAG TPA: hypothetical protein VNO79_14260, partial [Actinomycetota bacterium]|nr:hypothetical protein [Actinomycetota bacterium]
RERLERERYERLSPAYQRRLREREALARRAHGIFRALGGVLYGGAFHLGSPADPDRVEEARDEILRTVDVPEAKLAAILDGWLSRVEAGDGRGARAFLEEAAEELAQAGHRARPEDLDPRELAARIPRGPVFVQG